MAKKLILPDFLLIKSVAVAQTSYCTGTLISYFGRHSCHWNESQSVSEQFASELECTVGHAKSEKGRKSNEKTGKLF